MGKFDNLNFYTKSARPTLIDKFNCSNSYQPPLFSSAVLFIELRGLDTFESSRLIASFFVLRLLSGQKPYISRLNVFQTFKKSEYDSVVLVSIRGARLFDFLELLGYELLPFTSKIDVKSNIVKNKYGVVVNFTISDLSSIRIVETHSAFFRWHDHLKVNIHLLSGKKGAVCNSLLQLFRI